VGTLALLYVVPVFFMFFQRLHEKYQGGNVEQAVVEETNDPTIKN